MVYNLLKEIWFGALSIDEQKLSAADKLQIHFIFSGLVAVLGMPEVRRSPYFMSELAQTPVGKAAVSALLEVSDGIRPH